MATEATYYTDIFTVSFWKVQPKGTLFLTILQNKAKENNVDQAVLLLLEHCGRILDGIEEHLGTNAHNRAKVGLGTFQHDACLPISISPG
jgi:hypothetical protein